MKTYSNYIFMLALGFFIFSCKNDSAQKDGSQSGIENENTTSVPDTIHEMSVPENAGQQAESTSMNTGSPEMSVAKTDAKAGEDKGVKPENERPAVRPVPAPDKPVSLPDNRKVDKSDNLPDPGMHKKSDIQLFQQLLQKYVSTEGKVNYAGLKKEIKTLEAYALSLSDDSGFLQGTEKEKLALWINTYNAYTLLMVTRNYPVNSIRDLHAGKPWDAVWIRVGKRNYSLNQIENDVIRPLFGEPRIHFVLNCAARSCPPLLNTAITASNLENLLETATENFINSQNNVIRENKVEISSIFDWYRDDFGPIIPFLNRYSKIKIKDIAKISYLKYDWSLNH